MNQGPELISKTARFDVAIIGGALSGAAMALELLREQPKLKILIIERSARFSRRVGEATVEVSTYFLGHVLGLTRYLNESHLIKQGLRFWFSNPSVSQFDQCSEIGSRYLARLPSYQVDRAELDEEVLRRACANGAELWRPATVKKIQLHQGGDQVLEVRRGEQLCQVHCRWVVDASGVACTLARQEGWWRQNSAHPTTAVWSRWKNVADWDGLDLAAKYPDWAERCYGIRGTATNHFMGDGWWAWCIPLKGGDVSVGVVFDERFVDWPEQGSLGERLKEFLCRHPAAREIMAAATWREGDVHWRKHLPYYSTTFAGDGFALVGDAAGFLDPFYSPGMDWIAFTVMRAKALIGAQYRGERISESVEQHNRILGRSYERWFAAIYQDKYVYMGDYELMRTAFLLDLGFYYAGIASQPFRYGVKALMTPVFSNAVSTPFYYLMRTYNRRFASIAKMRRSRNQFGRSNFGQSFMFSGYTVHWQSLAPVVKALARWGMIELTEGWRTWGRRHYESQPVALKADRPVVLVK